jgi:hypothetical protein
VKTAELKFISISNPDIILHFYPPLRSGGADFCIVIGKIMSNTVIGTGRKPILLLDFCGAHHQHMADGLVFHILIGLVFHFLGKVFGDRVIQVNKTVLL